MNKDMMLHEVIADSSIQALFRALEIQAIRGNGLIRTNEFQRGVGKTTALVKFAKVYDLTVVVGERHLAEALKREFKYDKIIWEKSSVIRGIRDFVVDENVDLSRLGSKPITGFSKEDY